MKRPLSPWFAVALAIVALALGVAAHGSAQPRPAGAAGASLDLARKHMERGQALYAQKKYAEAADAFAAAYAAEPYAAFLYNEAVCHQKLGQLDKALSFFRTYLDADPTAPDAEQTRARIARIEAALAAAAAPPPATQDAAAPSGDAAAPAAPPIADEPVEMKSLVIIESEPSGAPVSVYRRDPGNSAAFAPGSQNAGWTRVASGSTPLTTSLDVGRYHIVIEPFADFHLSDTDMDVAPGHVHQFKANLRQGEFLAFLRVSSPEQGARIYLDDPPPHKRPPWGAAPHEGLIALGQHRVWVVRAGFQTASRSFSVAHGERRELLVELDRLPSGILRFGANAPAVEIEVDARPIGTFHSGAPLDVELPGGTHEIVARADGRKTLTARVDVARGRILPIDLVMMPKTPRGAAWTQAVVSAAFLGGGTFLGLRSNSVYDDLRDDQRAGTLTDDDDRYTNGKIYAIGADACFGVAGLLAALSTYNFIKDPTPPSVLRTGAPFDYPEPGSRPARQPDRVRPGPRRDTRLPPPSPSSTRGESLRAGPVARPSSAAFVLEWRF